MKTQRQQAIDWWNSIFKTKRDEISLEYYGTNHYIHEEGRWKAWARRISPKKE